MYLVNITIPPGFDGPQKANPAPCAHTEVYLRRIPNKNRGTLLQITSYEMGAKLADVPEEELGNSAEHYLMEFLSSIENKRTSFNASTPTRILLGDVPAARVEWTGEVDINQMSGVMYCAIVGTAAITLHTQGYLDSPERDRADAIQAIEAVTFAVNALR